MRHLALPCLAAAALGCLAHQPIHPRAAEEVRRGYEHLARGDAERAEVAFEHALAFDPDAPEAENGLGVVARVRGDLPAAEGHLGRAISLRPDFAEAHANLGELLLAQGRFEEAQDRLERALRIDPDLGDARQNLVRALLQRGLPGPGSAPGARGAPTLLAEARRHALHLLEAEPGRASAHADLAFLDYGAGRWAAAEAGYRRAAELDPRSRDAQLGLCLSLARLERCAEAARACRACLEIAPDDPRCTRSLEAVEGCAATEARAQAP